MPMVVVVGALAALGPHHRLLPSPCRPGKSAPPLKKETGRPQVCLPLGKANEKWDLIFWKDEEESDLINALAGPLGPYSPLKKHLGVEIP